MMSKWQPIETAPRDGTEVLTINSIGDFDIKRFDIKQNTWWDSGLTHWMPLPESPKDTK